MYDDLLTEYKRKQYCQYIDHMKKSPVQPKHTLVEIITVFQSADVQCK